MTRNALSNRPQGRQQGSAYIFALLILVVLTLIGLSLALISSTEMQVGANERLIQRTFYAADAGVGLSAARILVTSSYEEGSWQMNPAPGRTDVLVRNQVTLGPQIPLLEAPCNLCEINNSGSYNERAYRRANIVVTSLGERVTLDGSTQIANNTIAANLDIQPWKVATRAYEAVAIYPPEELVNKVKF